MAKKKPQPKIVKKPKAAKRVVTADSLRRRIEHKQQEITILEQLLTELTSHSLAGFTSISGKRTP